MPTLAALGAFAIALVGVWFGTRTAGAESEPTAVYADPAAANLFLGAGPLQIAERVQGVPQGPGLGAFQVHITYDPAYVTVDVSQGPFLSDTGGEVVCVKTPGVGEITYACISFGNKPGATGSGALAYVTVAPVSGLNWRAVPQNFAEVAIDNVTAELADPSGAAMWVDSVTDSRLFVRPLQSDVNVDCAVDQADVNAVASRLGIKKGSQSYSPLFDLQPQIAPDGDIDILDVQVVAADVGSTCASPQPSQPPPPPPCPDSDSDLLCDEVDLDVDNDGMRDKYEIAHACLDPLVADASADADSDGLASSEESLLGTDPCAPDSDADGALDGAEALALATDPLDADSDDDGLQDGEEVYSRLTDPLNPDSDSDALEDGDEVNVIGSDPLDADSDDDSLGDGDEVRTFGTSPLLADSEWDGLPDGYEVAHAGCGLDPVLDDGGSDADMDALPNLGEFGLGTDPCSSDSDGDRCTDGAEAQTAGGSELSGGLRDPLNPWDYFNPTHDGQNRVDDVLAVVQQYLIDAGNPAYTQDTDRTLVGPNAWNLGPPNGQQRTDDILHAVNQFFHDCP